MKGLILGRRDLIKLAALAGLFSVASCGISGQRSTLISYKGVLPSNLLKRLESQWRFELLKDNSSIDKNNLHLDEGVDLLALGDGWLNDLPLDSFQLIEPSELHSRLDRKAILFLSSFTPDIAGKLFPIGFSPWVILLRREEHLLPKARNTWEVLLEKELTGQLVLPKSPRLVMALADRMGYGDELRRLRLQAKTFDDENAINWVVSGKAKAAVAPLQYCMGALSRDPRLQIALPNEGAPLNWTILTRPKLTNKPLPYSWVREAWEMPLMGKLVAKGWFPPLPYADILKAKNYLSKEQQITVFPSEKTFDNFWSIAPLDNWDEKIMRERWLDSTP